MLLKQTASKIHIVRRMEPDSLRYEDGRTAYVSACGRVFSDTQMDGPDENATCDVCRGLAGLKSRWGGTR